MNIRQYEQVGISMHHGVTGSGLNVYVFPRPGYQTQYAFFAVNYGGSDLRFRLGNRRRNTPAGIAHYLEHKMFDMPGYSAMTKLTAAGAAANAYTSRKMTGYLFSCTDGFADNLRELLTYVTTPYFTPESVEKERGIIQQEIRMSEDNPSSVSYQGLMRALYAKHPAREPVVGTVESIAQITHETLYELHETFYRPTNMVLCCAGDIDPQQVMDLAEALVKGDKKKKAPARDYGRETGLLPVTVRGERTMAVSMPMFRLGGKLEWCSDGRDWLKRQLIAEVGCQLLLGDSSPLYAAMYAEGLINQSFSSGTMDFPGGGVYCAGGLCAEPTAVLGRIVDEAVRFQADGETQARFQRLKKTAQGGYLMGLDYLENLCSGQADGHFEGYQPLDFPLLYREITLEDAVSFIKESFRAERLAIYTVNPGA